MNLIQKCLNLLHKIVRSLPKCSKEFPKKFTHICTGSGLFYKIKGDKSRISGTGRWSWSLFCIISNPSLLKNRYLRKAGSSTRKEFHLRSIVFIRVYISDFKRRNISFELYIVLVAIPSFFFPFWKEDPMVFNFLIFILYYTRLIQIYILISFTRYSTYIISWCFNISRDYQQIYQEICKAIFDDCLPFLKVIYYSVFISIMKLLELLFLWLILLIFEFLVKSHKINYNYLLNTNK